MTELCNKTVGSRQGCSPRDRGLGLESTRDRFFPVLVLVLRPEVLVLVLILAVLVLVLVLVSKGRSWIFLKTDRVSGRLFASYFLQIKNDSIIIIKKCSTIISRYFSFLSKSTFLLSAVTNTKFLIKVFFAWTVCILFHTAIAVWNNACLSQAGQLSVVCTTTHSHSIQINLKYTLYLLAVLVLVLVSNTSVLVLVLVLPLMVLVLVLALPVLTTSLV